ncbi:hypothetical protein J437_LFUL007792 [Ladona fulva]|uniref:Chaoptin n=1 Tax=Ladona fulva TaxID=123851 RepID=A0A8K0JT45_LADFU|nr:hypothetical protein J437_LFUL007792 [Ladona fulva]
MRLVVHLCLLLFNAGLIEISCYDLLGYYKGGRWYRENAYSRSFKENFLHCKAGKECICGKERESNVFHCENEFNARFIFTGENAGDFEITCNVTLESKKLERDYCSIMEMDKVLGVNLHLINCPEPPESYPSLFAASIPRDESGIGNPIIYKLIIDCGLRKQFSLEKKHFEGLSELKLLEISCSALIDLPADIFRGRFPNLIDLKISNTLIKNIPDGLFSSVNALEKLTLESNEIVQINDNDFRGLEWLEKLLIDENNLLSFGENSFNYTPNLISFALFRSKVERLPGSFGKLVSLEFLHLANNSITAIEGFSDAFSNLREVIITNNFLNHIDFACFHSFGQVFSIDISGNSFSVLPDTSILMNELTTFRLLENTETLPKIHRFIVSEILTGINMEFSNIESIDPDFLHSVPALKYLRLTGNKISYLHEDFFAFNAELVKVSLGGNRISVIPDRLLRNNDYLDRLDLSSNRIQNIPPSLFSNTRVLKTLNLRDNLLESIPENLLTNLKDLQRIYLSNNRIRFIYNSSFVGLNSLQTLDIGNNFLNSSVANSFWPFKKFKNLLHLFLNGNSIHSIPPMDKLTLRYLNLANNSLQVIDENTFSNLKYMSELDLSWNNLEKLPNSSVVNGLEMEILKLSYNKIHDFPSEFIPRINQIYYLDLSDNRIERFDICSLKKAGNLKMLHLSNNGMHEIGDLSSCQLEFQALKLLNLSDNHLSFNNSLWFFDSVRKTWGRISPLLIFPSLEEIYMANNSISTVFMDWRNMLSKLRKLDLSHNKFEILTHQDLLFTSTLIKENGTTIPYPCHHSLILDLQFNQIKKLELPTKMLMQLPREHDMKLYGHVTINIDNNPFYCGCGVINFLRLLDGDVALTSELRRTEGKEWKIKRAQSQKANLAKVEPQLKNCVQPKRASPIAAFFCYNLTEFGCLVFPVDEKSSLTVAVDTGGITSPGCFIRLVCRVKRLIACFVAKSVQQLQIGYYATY